MMARILALSIVECQMIEAVNLGIIWSGDVNQLMDGGRYVQCC